MYLSFVEASSVPLSSSVFSPSVVVVAVPLHHFLTVSQIPPATAAAVPVAPPNNEPTAKYLEKLTPNVFKKLKDVLSFNVATTVGSKFIKYCDARLKDIGVDQVLQCVPAQNDWGKILERIGDHQLEIIYSRRL